MGDTVDVRNVDQNTPFLGRPALLADRGRFFTPLPANRHEKEKANFVYAIERSLLSERRSEANKNP